MIAVAFASDRKFLRHTAVALASLLTNLKQETDLSVFLLTDSGSEEEAKKLEDLKKIRPFSFSIRSVDDSSFREWPLWNGSRLPYARLLLPELFPETEKMLYLDSDIIVEKDLTELWNFPLNGKFLAAAVDREMPEKHRRGIGLQPGVPYLNTGVLLLDLEKMRKEKFLSRFLEMKRRFPEDPFVDQDPINRILQGNFAVLPEEWNSGWRHTLSVRPALPGIIHYCGWNVKMHPKAYRFPGYERYFHYRAMTPWKDENPPMDLRSRILQFVPWTWIRPLYRILALSGLVPLYRKIVYGKR